jgi:hypothetical protein
VTVLPDGRVTVHAEGVSAPWLMEELARATGAPLAGGPPAADPGTAPGGADAGELLRVLRQGSAEQRLAALARADEEGIALPRAELLRLSESDPSEQVRIAAFSTYIGEMSNEDGRTLREALMRALRSPTPAIQQEARMRLEELDEYERVNPPAQGQR